jgi:hypothetical protein
MTAIFKVEHNGKSRMMVIERIRDRAALAKVEATLLAQHADKAELVSIEDELLQYTANEVINERNLLGEPRRYSTGERTVTIPEGK